MPTRLDHLTIAPSDFAAGVAFYDAVLGALGLERLAEHVDEEEDEPVVEAAAWGPAYGAAIIWVVTAAVPTRGLHLQLRTESRQEVEACCAAAVEAGGSVHRAPRRWNLYRRGEFNAIVIDPDGNLVEAVAPE